MSSKLELWDRWTSEYIRKEDPIPLFNLNEENEVQTIKHGNNTRPVVERSPEMDQKIREEGKKVKENHEEGGDDYEGIIYIMYQLEEEEIVPRYVGKCGRHKEDSRELNSNLENIDTNDGKCGRWGYNHDYHLGDLSAVLFNDHKHHDGKETNKYKKWEDALFEDSRTLKQPVYFWVKAWHSEDDGLYSEVHPYLAELEYQIIGFAYKLYPERLLNDEGIPNNPDAFAKMKGWVGDERTQLSDFD